MTKHIKNTYLLYSFLIITSLVTAFAEEEPLVVLPEFVVTSPIDPSKSVLPNDHPFNSLYGYETGILDTPRNITIISKTQLESISLKDPRDFTKLTTSSYTGSNFGAPTTPSIRGQKADTLLNGMRKGMTNNGNGLPLNMNSVESVNILKGPPSVMVGVSQYVGGYVDLVSKRPTGINEGSLTVTVDSEGLRKAQIDQSFVISDTLQFRASITGEDSDDYYWDDYYRKTFAAYGALVWTPSDHFKLEVLAEYYNANYTENWGINRPTKDLIDNLEYVTGIGSFNGENDMLTTTGIAKIDRETRLHGEGDDSNGDYASLQIIQTFTPNPDVEIVNNSLLQYRDRDTYSSYQYSEVLRDNIRLENRTEVRTEVEFLDMKHQLNLGIAFSYQDVWAVNDYYNEPANAWDLVNQSYSDIGVTDATVFNTVGFFNSFPIRSEKARGKLSARPGSTSSDYFISSTGEYILGNADSNDSQTTTTGIFIQDKIQISERLSVLIGGRLDYVYVESEDPMFEDMLRYLQSLEPGNDYSAVKQAKDSHGDYVPNFNLGFVYSLKPTQRIYLNYNYSESIPVDLGGGIALSQNDVFANPELNGKLLGDAFDSRSELLELGYKGTFFDGTMYLMANLFQQDRLDPQSQGGDQKIETRGFELEFHYQPSERFFLVAGYSYIDSVTKNGINITRQPISSVPSTGGDYRYGTLVEFKGYESKTPGVPEHIINALASYKLTDELSMSLGLLVTSPMNLAFEVPASENMAVFPDPGPLGTSEIPWQYSIDLGLKYETDRWAASLHVLNLTDEENWGAVEGLYGNDSIFAELPRRYEFTLTLKW